MFIVIIVFTVSKNHYRDSHNNIYHPREYLSVSVCFHTNTIYFPYSMICLYACTHYNKHKPGNQAFWLHIIPRYAGQFNIESIFSSVYILANITWIWNGANFRLLYQWLVKPIFFLLHGRNPHENETFRTGLVGFRKPRFHSSRRGEASQSQISSVDQTTVWLRGKGRLGGARGRCGRANEADSLPN